MKVRRSLALALALCLMAPLVAGAQPARKVYRIGWLFAGDVSRSPHLAAALREGLREWGYVEGENVVIETRSAHGQLDRLPVLAADLVRAKVDVIISSTTPTTRAAKQTGTSVPIVMIGVADPVGAGFAGSLSRPGGNITGTALAWTEGFPGKWVELIKEAVPSASRVGVILNSANTAHDAWLRDIKTAAGRLAVKLQVFGAQDLSGLDNAFAAVTGSRVEALVVLSDPFLFSHRARIVEAVSKSHLPAVYAFREFVDAGGMMSYGVNQAQLFRRAGYYVDKILKGAKPGDLPVEQPTKFELVINLKTAKALGLTIPPSLLLRADQVIE